MLNICSFLLGFIFSNGLGWALSIFLILELLYPDFLLDIGLRRGLRPRKVNKYFE